MTIPNSNEFSQTSATNAPIFDWMTLHEEDKQEGYSRKIDFWLSQLMETGEALEARRGGERCACDSHAIEKAFVEGRPHCLLADYSRGSLLYAVGGDIAKELVSALPGQKRHNELNTDTMSFRQYHELADTWYRAGILQFEGLMLECEDESDEYGIYVGYYELKKQACEIRQKYHSKLAGRVDIAAARTALKEFQNIHRPLSELVDVAENVIKRRTSSSNYRPEGIYKVRISYRDEWHFYVIREYPPLLAEQEFKLKERL